MVFLIFSGVVALLFGALLMTMPDTLKKCNASMSAYVDKFDNFIFKYNQGSAICLLLSGATLIFVAYYLYRG